ncbi:hypothetical protein BVC80_7455g2 [Macleaya cordata]|uniref:RNase H type-1 domain-containing protein n=1 Tax=Macleaya cordata TaxID=56857 RepID=A0A200Q0N9_MACCD|nr:hypothetical protein BVC80_7455g2 [Macleaya cordata]
MGRKKKSSTSFIEVVTFWIIYNEETYRLGACLLWYYWKARNKKIFDKSNLVFKDIYKSALHNYNDFTSELLQDTPTKSNILLNHQSLVTCDERWIPPPNGEIKINVDAAFKDFIYAVAVVGRDLEGKFMGCITKIGKANSAEQVELSAFSLGLEFSNRFTNLVTLIEGDALKVSTWINDLTSNVPWNLLPQVLDARFSV